MQDLPGRVAGLLGLDDENEAVRDLSLLGELRLRQSAGFPQVSHDLAELAGRHGAADYQSSAALKPSCWNTW